MIPDSPAILPGPPFCLRASPHWRLALLDRLSPGERTAIAGSLAPDTYGVLYSLEGTATPRAVGPDAALLFLTLIEPSPLPAYLRATFGEDAEDAVAELIADGVLEVEVDGGWLSGPRASRALTRSRPSTSEVPAGRSLQAIRAAAALPTNDVESIASFLYRYGTTPITPQRARLWGEAGAVWNVLRLGDFGRPATLSSDSAWWVFPGSRTARETGFSPKLYLGIALGALPEALSLIAAVWSRADSAPAFKVGATTHGVHRPDRVVFYPATVGEAVEWAARLAEIVSHLPADPVPFTASFVPGGHLCWGADPPDTRASWEGEGSWRGLVTRKLAGALVAARQAGEPQPWLPAMDRVRLAGIDPATWVSADLGWTL